MAQWRKTAFRRAVVLGAVLILHGSVMMFFAHSVYTASPEKKDNVIQITSITVDALTATDLPITLPVVAARAASEYRPVELAKTLSDQALKKTTDQQEFDVGEPANLPSVPANESANLSSVPASESATLPSVSSGFSLHYHLAARDGLAVKHGEATLTFNNVADQYVTDFAWKFDDQNGGMRSEGKLLTTVRPSVYIDATQIPKTMSGQVQDSVSVIWMVRQLIQQRYGASASEDNQSKGNFLLLIGNEVVPYRWDILQTDQLMLPGGTYNGILVQISSDMPKVPVLAMWFTPSIPYLPVRIRSTDANGMVMDYLLKDNLSEIVKAT